MTMQDLLRIERAVSSVFVEERDEVERLFERVRETGDDTPLDHLAANAVVALNADEEPLLTAAERHLAFERVVLPRLEAELSQVPDADQPTVHSGVDPLARWACHRTRASMESLIDAFDSDIRRHLVGQLAEGLGQAFEAHRTLRQGMPVAGLATILGRLDELAKHAAEPESSPHDSIDLWTEIETPGLTAELRLLLSESGHVAWATSIAEVAESPHVQAAMEVLLGDALRQMDEHFMPALDAMQAVRPVVSELDPYDPQALGAMLAQLDGAIAQMQASLDTFETPKIRDDGRLQAAIGQALSAPSSSDPPRLPSEGVAVAEQAVQRALYAAAAKPELATARPAPRRGISKWLLVGGAVLGLGLLALTVVVLSSF